LGSDKTTDYGIFVMFGLHGSDDGEQSNNNHKGARPQRQEHDGHPHQHQDRGGYSVSIAAGFRSSAIVTVDPELTIGQS